MIVVKNGLQQLYGLLDDLKYRSHALSLERQTGIYTNFCSRSDLLHIAKLLPPRDNWNSDAFTKAKDAAMERFKIKSRKFCLALKKIQESREMNAIFGVETPLLHVSDGNARLVISEWRRLHAHKNGNGSIYMDLLSSNKFNLSNECFEIKENIVENLSNRFGDDAVADIEAIFYLVRNNNFSEYYDDLVQKFKRETHDGNVQRISRMLGKTNFVDNFICGVSKLGRPSLAENLRAA